MQLHRLMGLGSVSSEEHPRARFVAKLFDNSMVVVVVLLAVQWHLQHVNLISMPANHLINSFVWLFIAARLFIPLFFVRHRASYLLDNVTYLFILFIGLTLLFRVPAVLDMMRTYRILLVLALLVPWFDHCFQCLSDNRLTTTIWSVLVITVLAGVFISDIDPNVHSIRDGIWWAWATVSTVGYGDVVPTSMAGRILGGFLILMGLGIFAVLTANFSAIFVQRKVSKVGKIVEEEQAELQVLSEQLDTLLTSVQSLDARLKSIEERL
ncbi:MAG: capsular polysaccharide biosynthesis protein [marine bacterium B5-7]|nr:MAG: capsular polysaccharide biosynthesis protein [marine bacterium B5-7]